MRARTHTHTIFWVNTLPYFNLTDRTICPDYVDSLSPNALISHGIFQSINLDASKKSKLIDINFIWSTNLSMVMFWSPKKDYKIVGSTPGIKYKQQKMFTAPK